jgi:hypothetical protein
MIASEGPAVDAKIAAAAPILDTNAQPLGPTLNYQPVPGLPPELQPDPGDILLKEAFWPWEDMGAQGIPESWLYMSRKIQGVIAQMAVQTPNGPRLVNADVSGRLAAIVANDAMSPLPVANSTKPFYVTKNNATLTRWNTSAAGGIATTTQLGGGFFLVVDHLGGSIVSGGTAGSAWLQVKEADGVVWEQLMSVSATPGDKDRINITGLAILLLLGHDLTVTFSAGIAQAVQDVTTSFYLATTSGE